MNLEEEARNVLAPLLASGVQVVFEAPKPIFEITPFRCSDWFDRSNPACRYGHKMAKDQLEQYRLPVVQLLSRLATQLPEVSVWDPFPVLCPDAQCHTAREGRPLFFDADHVSGYGNMMLTPDFRRFISSLRQDKASL